jgi:hypothetical protein
MDDQTDRAIPIEVMSVTLWHSTDEGQTWNRVEVSTTSPLAMVWFNPDETYDDGNGNLYRPIPPQRRLHLPVAAPRFPAADRHA